SRVEELIPPHQRLALFVDPFGRLVEASTDGQRRAFHADDAGPLERTPLVGAEPLDLLLDQLADILPDPRFAFAESTTQTPVALFLDDDPFVDQIADEIDEEQRIALAAAMNHVSQSSGKLMALEPGGDVLRNGRLGQAFQRKLSRHPMRLQFTLDSL